MSKAIWVGAGIVAVVVLGGIAYLQYGQPAEETPAPVVAAPSAPSAPAPPAVAEAAQDNTPPSQDKIIAPPSSALPQLPDLADSDKPVQAALENLFGKSTLGNLLIPEKIIRRIVATIDSLDGDPVSLHLRPLRYVEGLPAVNAADDGGVTLSPENFKRYAPYVNTFKTVDAKAVADFYLRYQSLFQKAHEELGNTGQPFNDRLLKVIDKLLATPEVKAPIRLVRPKVFYEFEDYSLEERPSGQKILIRMGPANAAVVKAKLREIRAALTAAR
jgi:hypothetical protein